jgi:hypothetical protein
MFRFTLGQNASGSLSVRALVPVAIFAAVLFLSSSVRAQTTVFNYQGRLTELAAAASGTYDFQFALYDAATAGTQQGTSPQTITGVAVAAGVFTVGLDFGSTPFSAGADRYLEIRVKKPVDSTYTTLTPRQQIKSVPYALHAPNAAIFAAVSPVDSTVSEQLELQATFFQRQLQDQAARFAKQIQDLQDQIDALRVAAARMASGVKR